MTAGPDGQVENMGLTCLLGHVPSISLPPRAVGSLGPHLTPGPSVCLQGTQMGSRSLVLLGTMHCVNTTQATGLVKADRGEEWGGKP